jgi:hypothetical protein
MKSNANRQSKDKNQMIPLGVIYRQQGGGFEIGYLKFEI